MMFYGCSPYTRLGLALFSSWTMSTTISKKEVSLVYPEHNTENTDYYRHCGRKLLFCHENSPNAQSVLQLPEKVDMALNPLGIYSESHSGSAELRSSARNFKQKLTEVEEQKS